MIRPPFRNAEAERDQLHRLSLRHALTDRQADRLAYLDFLAAHRGFALYRPSHLRSRVPARRAA